jgi:uncharacterized protein YegP (UPF0339 family)
MLPSLSDWTWHLEFRPPLFVERQRVLATETLQRCHNAAQVFCMRYEIFKEAGLFFWRLMDGKNAVVRSGQGHSTKTSCQLAIDLLKATTARTPVIDVTVQGE